MAINNTNLRDDSPFHHGERSVQERLGVRDIEDHHPLRDEVRNLVADRPNIDVHTAYSRPGPEDELEPHYDSQGRVTGELLRRLVRNVDAHYFLCGPTRFMAEVQAALEQQNVPAEQIHYETFGPST